MSDLFKPQFFDWDDSKAASNEARHGVSFRFGLRIFDDPQRVQAEDHRQDYGETRWSVVGMIDGRLFQVIFTFRGVAARLISVRPAHRKERKGMAIVRISAEEAFKNSVRLTAEQRARLDAMTDDDIEAAANSDPDAQLWTDEMLDRGVFARAVRRAREATGLSQSEFARQFRIGAARLKNWEQGRFPPDEMALAYLEVIRQSPDVVRAALGPAKPVPPKRTGRAAAE